MGLVQTEALLKGVELTSPWLLMLAGALSGAKSPADMDAGVDVWAAEVERDVPVATLLYESGLRAWMAAQLLVRSVESDGVQASRGLVLGRRDEVSFLSLPFEDAIQFFRDKSIITPEEFRLLQDRFRAGGFTAVRLASEALRARAKAAILAALQGGATVDETIRRIREDSLALGIEPETHGYLATVVRTNIATAYGHGRLQAMADPVVRTLRPYWQYLSAGDSRVRPAHRELHGKVFAADDEAATHYFPPLGFNCRCTMVTLSQRQVDARGLAVTTGRIDGVTPDSGWEGAPRLLDDA